MRTLHPRIRREIEKQDDELVQTARSLAEDLRKSLKKKDEDKRRQLRNIQDIAESSDSWKALELFIRYQAARDEIDRGWAESAIQRLERLQEMAQSLASQVAGADARAIHLALVSRVLGYAVRWHTWDTKA
jgi:hypothetical protein